MIWSYMAKAGSTMCDFLGYNFNVKDYNYDTYLMYIN